MQKFTVSILAIAAGVMLAAGTARANSCAAGDAFCADTNDGSAGSGNPLVDVTSMLPAQGIAAAGTTTANDPATGYVFVDGDSTNQQDPFDGYVGISAADAMGATGPLVGNDDGDFRRGGPNSAMTELLPPPPSGLPSLP